MSSAAAIVILAIAGLAILGGALMIARLWPGRTRVSAPAVSGVIPARRPQDVESSAASADDAAA